MDHWVGRRAHPRLDMNLPVHFGLINIKQGGESKSLFSAVTMDVSVQGLGIRMHSRVAQMIPIAIKLMGDRKQFDLKLGIDLTGGKIHAVGEVKWSLLEIPHQLKMGIFLKGMGPEAEDRWTNFIQEECRKKAHNLGPSSRVISFLQVASNHLDKASDRISQQMRGYEVKPGK